MKKALLIGTTKLISTPNKTFHLWNCRECGELFNCYQTKIFKIIECPCCHKEIELGDITNGK